MVAVVAFSIRGVIAADAGEFEQYHHDVQINAARQDAANNGAGIRVGVIDTDIDLDHDEYADRVVEVIADPVDYFAPGNHGTEVTGIIAAARDDRGMVGIAPRAEIVSAWYFDDDGDEPISFGGSLVPWTEALLEQNVNVINASLGTDGGSLFDVMDGLKAMSRTRNNAVFVISAGNSGTDLQDAACGSGKQTLCKKADKYFGHVLVVGALDSKDELASFSNRPGDACFYRRSSGFCRHHLKRWFLVAPGTGVMAPVPGNEYRDLAGTSAAAPIVSGGAALIMSKWPHLKDEPQAVARILLETADDLGKTGVDEVFGYGRLNLKAALEPVGTPVVATGGHVGGEATALRGTSLVTSGAFGESLATALASNEAVVFDDFGRDFAIDPSRLVRVESTDVDAHDLFMAFMRGPVLPPEPSPSEAPTLRMAFAADTDSYGHLPPDGFMVAGTQGPVQFGFASDHDATAFGDALEGSVEANDPITAFRADTHHMNLVGPARAFGGTYEFAGKKASVGLVVAQRSSRPQNDVLASGDDAVAVELRSQFRPTDRVTLHTRSGYVREDGSVLGAEGNGAFGIAGSDSYYLGARLSTEVGGGLTLDLDVETGWIAVAGSSNSLLESGGRLRTESGRISLAGRDMLLDGDAVSLGITQPLRIADGNVGLRLPVGRTLDGKVLYHDADLSAEPKGRELRVSLDYTAPLPEEIGRWQISAVERVDPGHDPNQKPQTLLFGKVAFAF